MGQGPGPGGANSNTVQLQGPQIDTQLVQNKYHHTLSRKGKKTTTQQECKREEEKGSQRKRKEQPKTDLIWFQLSTVPRIIEAINHKVPEVFFDR